MGTVIAVMEITKITTAITIKREGDANKRPFFLFRTRQVRV